MASTHVDELFSAALDDELSEEQERRFREHLRTCSRCTSAYRTYSRAIDSVHKLPRAAMPLPVHLPPGRPAAERRTAAAWLRRLQPRGVPFGAGTGIAAIVAAVIVVVGVTRGAGPAPAHPASTTPNGSGSGAGSATPASCPGPATAATPPSFAYRVTASDPSRPGQQLVVAASTRDVAAGSQVQLYASLTVPPAAAGPPGAQAAAVPVGVTPCVSVSGLPSNASSALGRPPVAEPNAAGAAAPAGTITLTVPPGTATGTVLHVVASVPSGYPVGGQPPLSADLTLVVQ
jgi:hypothetical protein